jgi:dihydroxyacid dehydratase/phosphogluconate dehydratase
MVHERPPRREIEVTKLNRRSQLITAGVARSPNRAMLRAVGFKDGDFEKAIVGVGERSLYDDRSLVSRR